MEPTSKVLRIPVVSGIEGLSAAVRRLLSTPAASSCSSAPSASRVLFAQSRLEIVDVPPPPPPSPSPPTDAAAASAAWALSPEQREAVERASVMLADASVGAHLLLPVAGEDARLPRPQALAWVQSTFAGVEPFFDRLARLGQQDATPRAPPAFALTRAGGVMPAAMAQYVLGWVVALERKLLQAEAHRQRGEFAQEAMRYRSFRGLTVGVLGLGDIGQAVGRLLKLAGFRVAGLKRRIGGGDDAGGDAALRACADVVTDDLDAVLAQADYVVNVLPSTPATRRLLTEARLAAACGAKSPALINVGRGDVMAEAAIVAALDRGLLSMAVLDVFEREPLPADSQLWTHPKVRLTPHVAALSLPDDVADVFVRNLDLFLSREPLLYPADWVRGY